MGWRFDIAPRDALAAPTSGSQTNTLSTVILIVSILSLLGAGWIMLSYACFKSLRTFRHQLILGLAVSDAVMAANFLTSSGMNLGGRYIGDPAQQGFCSFNGFITQTFVIQTDYWVLLIAVCTYLILADHKRASSWVQDHCLLLASLPWIFSVLWAAIGLGVAGYGSIGAWCWFTSDEVRLLVNFLPRWLIIFIMLAMYARLYLVLFRAHRFLSSDEESSGHPTSQSRTLDAAMSSTPQPGNSHGGPYARGVRPSGNSRRLKKLARLMLMYPIAYMLIWTLPTSIRIYQATTGMAAPFILQTIDKACIVMQGFVDAVIYGVNESSMSSWRNLLFPELFPTIEGTSASPTDHRDPPATKKAQRARSSRLDDVPGSTGDSTSSFELGIIPDCNNSATCITTADSGAHRRSYSHDGGQGGSEARVQDWETAKERFELRRLSKTVPGPLGIRKTVEVNVVHEAPGAAAPGRGLRVQGKGGRTFFEG